MKKSVNDIFQDLELGLKKENNSSEDLQNWNLNYFKNHQSRFRSDLETVQETYTGGKILEIGSAPLHFTYVLKNLDFPVTGVDIDPKRFDHFIAENELDIKKCNVETEPLPFEDQEFHLIIFNEIFEHMRINPIATLKEIRRVLHPEGHLILSTPNLYSITTFVNFILGKGFDDPYEQFDKIEKFGHMGHVREYSVSQLRKFLVKTGYKPVKVKLQSHKSLKGLWTPFNLVRIVLPKTRAFQTYICKI